MDVDVCRIASAHEIALLIAILRIADEDVSIIIVGMEQLFWLRSMRIED